MDIDRLNRVLRRVRNEEPAAEERLVLERLIHAEAEACREYEYVRSRCSGRPQVVLTQIWTQEQKHYRDLQAEYAARYGNSVPQSPEKPVGRGGVLSMLGRIREREFAAVEEYSRHGKATGDFRLSLLYQNHAREKRPHAKLLTQLLRQGMG